MIIGLIVHSLTGNTLSVAERLQKKLQADGHRVELRRLEPVGGEDKNEIDINKIRFNPAPEISGFDAVIMAAPVRGFSVSPVWAAYLSQVASLKGLKVDLFVTQAFPYPWMGGNRAVRQMKTLCERKGAVVGNTAVVNWRSRKRDAKIREVIDRLGKRQV